jgi:hypothetical protein
VTVYARTIEPQGPGACPLRSLHDGVLRLAARRGRLEVARLYLLAALATATLFALT